MALTDILELRVVELGKIKIGGLGEERTAKSGAKWRAPRKDDHFTITTTARDNRGDLVVDKPLMDELIAKYGDPDGKLRQIPIYVLSDDIEEVMQAAFVCYKGKAIVARSDGKTMTKFREATKNEQTGRMDWLPLPQPIEKPWDKSMESLIDKETNAPFFKRHTTFNCVVASENARWGGVYKFRTTSPMSGNKLLSSLTHIQELTGGVLSGIPLKLVITPVQVNPLVNGRNVASTVYVVHCELLGRDLVSIRQQAARALEESFRQAQTVKRIKHDYKSIVFEPGLGETVDEHGEIQEEFHPEPPRDPVPDAEIVPPPVDMPPEGRVELPPASRPSQEGAAANATYGAKVTAFVEKLNEINDPATLATLVADVTEHKDEFGPRWSDVEELIQIKEHGFAAKDEDF